MSILQLSYFYSDTMTGMSGVKQKERAAAVSRSLLFHCCGRGLPLLSIFFNDLKVHTIRIMNKEKAGTGIRLNRSADNFHSQFFHVFQRLVQIFHGKPQRRAFSI